MSKRRFRSRNPDLLFPDEMDARVKKMVEFWRWRMGAVDELDRVTAFVTHRCNLFCQYCMGPHMNWREGDTLRKRKMLRTDMTVPNFERLLEETRTYARIRHIHFTGGEPTINRDLPTLVALATKQGILSSITTNGTARPELYSQLIENGLTEVRISIDTPKAETFDSLVGIQGAFQRVAASIKEITHLRDEEGKDVFLVLNACVGEPNLAQIEETLRFLISLAPDDIKFLVIVQDRQFVIGHQGAETVAHLKSLLDQYPPEQFPLLRTKIENLFNPNAVGLEDQETQRVMEHCFIPTTERTIDGEHYYPCSIYVRYYGQPLGPLTDPFEKQQAKILGFVRSHDCRQDPICRAFCTNCCKLFNLRANQALVPEGEWIIQIADDVRPKEIRATIAQIRALLSKGQPSDRPFMVIKPHGQQWEKRILDYLAKIGLLVESITPIAAWEDCARYIYGWPLTEEKIRFTLEMDRAFRQIEQGQADILRFKHDPKADDLTKIKMDLRRIFPSRGYLLAVAGRKRRIRLTAIHTPNPGDARRENTILGSLIGLLKPK